MKQGRTYTREEIVSKLNADVAKEEKHWGVNSFWADMARNARERKLADYDSGKAIVVETEPYCENHMDFEDEYMSDGTVRTACYGFYD